MKKILVLFLILSMTIYGCKMSDMSTSTTETLETQESSSEESMSKDKESETTETLETTKVAKTTKKESETQIDSTSLFIDESTKKEDESKTSETTVENKTNKTTEATASTTKETTERKTEKKEESTLQTTKQSTSKEVESTKKKEENTQTTTSVKTTKATQSTTETTTAAPTTTEATTKATEPATTAAKNTTSSINGFDMCKEAIKYIGTPYVWGGESLTEGVDCSGLTMKIYALFGISLPHSAAEQTNMGTPISEAEALPGDLVVYGNHCGLYIGNGYMINANPLTGYLGGVVVAATDAWDGLQCIPEYRRIYNNTCPAISSDTCYPWELEKYAKSIGITKRIHQCCYTETVIDGTPCGGYRYRHTCIYCNSTWDDQSPVYSSRTAEHEWGECVVCEEDDFLHECRCLVCGETKKETHEFIGEGAERHCNKCGDLLFK